MSLVLIIVWRIEAIIFNTKAYEQDASYVCSILDRQAISNHRRIERLHFPQDGDSNLFIKCGRKHFTDKYNNASPYASQSQNISQMNIDKGY